MNLRHHFPCNALKEVYAMISITIFVKIEGILLSLQSKIENPILERLLGSRCDGDRPRFTGQVFSDVESGLSPEPGKDCPQSSRMADNSGAGTPRFHSGGNKCFAITNLHERRTALENRLRNHLRLHSFESFV
jgi:hypothetical protein